MAEHLPFDAASPAGRRIWDVAARRRLSEADLTARVRSAEIVLLGEMHDNPDHHRLEAKVLSDFAARHDAPTVVFEMLDRRRQSTVDSCLAAQPGARR